MGYEVLALKWRPHSFTEVVGQQSTLQALANSLDSKQLHHSYLFTGTRGVGKTTIARILAKCLNCDQGISSNPCNVCKNCKSIESGSCVDVIEIDAASRTKVEDTRELLENVPYAPTQSRFKVYIIDEVHMLSQHSFNALLKTLEEPPSHVKFILATTDPQKLPVTIISRCLHFKLQHFGSDQIVAHLEKVLQKEKIQYEPEALFSIAKSASGSMRDALSLLEQVIAFGGNKVDVSAATSVLGASLSESIIQLLEAVVAGNGTQIIATIKDMSINNIDFTQALKSLQTAIHNLALAQVVPDAVTDEKIKSLATIISPVDVQIYYQATLLGARDLPYAPDMVSGFEMIVLRMLAFEPQQQQASFTRQEAKPKPPVKSLQDKLVNNLEPKISNNWHSIIADLKLSGLTKVIAENCIIKSMDDNNIELQLQEAQKPLFNEKHLIKIRDALSVYYNKDIKLKISTGVSEDTPVAAIERKVKNNQHIKDLQKEFSATITKIETQE